ncbi:Alpha-ketoglutaric semialdehyde dehydrogenase [Rubripirellula obstinata]|uniref:Alpha-ketoglutaric semialdehyde dehydrogenase n=1 Tax=Rubripirellula obstinata TaxID=406547 RepID=A0A5B1CHI7_9BACT|nr:aldehyde dehydrogenase (NADP(+)) [Rubripirellula obstinata]KAA1259405.1 Alpha-ketoglutaric semialdehyde dehydrogenase [Rubripirellula obstinata]
MNSILINGDWQSAKSSRAIQAIDPTNRSAVGETFPVSDWADCETVMDAAQAAAVAMEDISLDDLASFLNAYADNLEKNAESICEVANQETGLPVSPRLLDVEMPRTIDQLRQAAAAAKDHGWRNPVHDHDKNIHSCLTPIGPVLIFGPNNFPLAFNAISGGDFAAAIAAGNPVIAKAHPSQPGTSRLLAEQALDAAKRTGMPAGIVQMLYDIDPSDGLKMVADSRIAAVAFTGSRRGGTALKAAADQVGKPIYLEMSSINPVFLLQSALERGEELSDEAAGSCLLAAGQFCTSPNLIVIPKGEKADEFLQAMTAAFKSKPAGTLLSEAVLSSLKSSIEMLVGAGVEILAGGKEAESDAFAFANTLMKIDSKSFLENEDALQTEAFGPASLVVVCEDEQDALAIAKRIHGSLTASVYGKEGDAAMVPLTKILQRVAGRVIHNKMPTGVAVSPAMNHGGPYPATGHPRFTAVGIPASLERFAKLSCFDNVAESFLPACLR